MKTKPESFIDFMEFTPSLIMTNFYAITKYGKRTVMIGCVYTGYRYTDCVSPHQNSYCNPSDIIYWKYVDDKLNEDLHFNKSIYGAKSREEEADKILSLVKPMNLLERLMYKIRKTKVMRKLMYIIHSSRINYFIFLFGLSALIDLIILFIDFKLFITALLSSGIMSLYYALTNKSIKHNN